ncbi:hypothetical protein OCUBac02_15900 [Bosea sp. ANAM02]|nr:hypothetical protein OCUBac02_15900 [Bosea sp. ANAM02]
MNQRYQHIRDQLHAFNAQGPVSERNKLSSRIMFEHVVRGLIDEMGGLAQDGPFNAAWMTFCQENLVAEKRIATDDRTDAYERGRADAMRSLGIAPALPFGTLKPHRFDPTRPDKGVILVGQGNGRDTASSDVDVILARQQALTPTPAVHSTGLSNVSTVGPTDHNGAACDVFVQPPAASSPKKDDVKRLSDFLEEYLAGRLRVNGDDRARSEIGPIVTFAIALIGDKRPRDYDRDDFSKLNAEIPRIPTPKNIPAHVGRTLYARYRYGIDNPDAKLVTAAVGTIKKNYHAGLDRFFNWLHKQRLIDVVPVLDETTPQNRAALPRDSFEDDEILKLVSLPLFTGCHSRKRCWTEGRYLIQGSVYWQYLILLLTGMRTGEVGPLKVDDLIVSHGFACFDLRPFDARKGRVTLAELRTLKTSASARVVPIHPLLVELGLLDHRDEMARHGVARLFPDCEPYKKPDGQLRWSQEMTKSWQYVKRRFNVANRQDVTLYSTRHTMADMIDQLKLSARTRDRVLGHANSETSAGNYGRNGLLSADEFKEFSGITSPLIEGMREILVPRKQDADAGRLILLRPTRPLTRAPGKKKAD